MSSPAKILKKGEYLFKEGDKPTHIYMIQSGAISLGIQRPKKNIELILLSSGQVVGEIALTGVATHPYSAVATVETKIVEIPLEIFRQSIENSGQMIKVLVKSMAERIKLISADLRSSKGEKEPLPCSDEQVPRVFGAIYHSCNHKGQKDSKNPDQIKIELSQLKTYSQRIFNESPKRIEQALNILAKLKICQFEMGKSVDDPEGPDQIIAITLTQASLVETIFEFFQYHYYKSGPRNEVLKVDETVFTQLYFILSLTEGLTPDRLGIVSMEYTKLLEKMKSDFGINLTTDSFLRMEQKGLLAKRHQRQDGQVFFQFELKEFKNILFVWRVIKEIEKWNEKGFVDLNEEEQKPRKKGSNEPTCPQCQSTLLAKAKFCSECGFKIAA